MNTGEGDLSPYHLEGGCDIVFQMGTTKFGVRDEDGNLDDARLAQGAKPGKGSILLTANISPNRHAEVDDWYDLLDFTPHVSDVLGCPLASKP